MKIYSYYKTNKIGSLGAQMLKNEVKQNNKIFKLNLD